ncbi:MAG TPA: methyltransferase domain-containing protein [Polyangiaceae bacterium]|nr:methyltransferase domain-containing protein [Polyangiaceae bacterium]
MIRVLLLSLHYRPEPNFITADVAQRLAREGFAVTVVTAHPNYPLGRFYDSVSTFVPARSEEGGVSVWRLPFLPDHSTSKLRRFLAYGSFTLAAALFAPFAEPSPDLVWVYNAPFTTGAAALWFRYARGSKIGFICPDLWPESFEAAGVSPPRPILQWMYAYSRWINRRADLLVATTRGMLRRYEADGIPRSRLRFAPLWVDGVASPPRSEAPAEGVGLPRLMYAGNLGPAQALDVVLHGARMLKGDGVEVKIDFYGAGSEEARLSALARDLGLSGVSFRGRVSQAEVFRAAAGAAAQIVHLTPSPFFSMTVPSKLASCLAAGRPVLAGVPGESLDIAKESGGAIGFEAGNAEDFERAVIELLAMSPEERAAMGARGRRYFEENMHPDALLARYVRYSEELLQGGAEISNGTAEKASTPGKIEIHSCPVCGGAARSPWLHSLGFDLVRCLGCGHRYSAEVLSEAELAGTYYAEPDADIAARSLAAKRARFREYKAMIERDFPKRGRVLDVGCNAGELLELFREAGWSVAGVEASPGPAAYARKKLASPVWQGPAEDVIPEGEIFDLITMTHVLEHVKRPGDLLNRLRRALRPGGSILIEVPNADDALLGLFRGYYRPLCPGDHVSFFDEGSLRRLLEGSGFSVLSTASPAHARDLVYSSALSAVDFTRSLARRGSGAREGGGVMAQTRYRGRFRAPLRRALDRLVEGVDPFVFPLARAALGSARGPVLIVLARSTTELAP